MAIAQLPPPHSPLLIVFQDEAIQQTDRKFPVVARVPFPLVTHSNPLKMSFELGYILNGAIRIIAF